MVIKDIVKIVVAIFLVIIAWKIFKGLLSIAITVAAIGLLIWGVAGLVLAYVLGGYQRRREGSR